MKYVFTAEQNASEDQTFFDDTDTAYLSALNCARGSIESIFYDYPVMVVCTPPNIEVSSDDLVMPFTLSECKALIIQSFQDANGDFYPEFKGVEGKIV